VKEAQALRRLKRWVYKTDITAFFDSIDRDVLREKIAHHVRDRSLHQVLISAANCELAPTSREKEKRIKAAGIQVGKGVRQGMPLSPFFANLLLKNFDESIQNANISMVRYADDLICFCETNDACSAAHDLVGAALLKEGLAVPPVGPQSKIADLRTG
jgi:RNA-directed DNA polymerase